MVHIRKHVCPLGRNDPQIQTVEFHLGTDFDAAYRMASFLHMENGVPVQYKFNDCEILTSRERGLDDAQKKYRGGK